MVFSTSSFLFLFLPAVIIGYYLISLICRRLLNLYLFAVSLIFYCWNGTQYLFLLLFSVGFNYTMALTIAKTGAHKKLRRLFLVVSVLINIGILGYYKYFGFILTNINTFTGKTGFIKTLALPIGISFYTFQALSYVIDVYRDEKAVKNPINLGMYITFFPQLIAGPIVRFSDIKKDLSGRKLGFRPFLGGFDRFLLGLCKKVLLANNLGALADTVFDGGNPDHYSILMIWLAVIAYALQIYYDFSGYSDMAIGLGRIFGFHFPENFHYPYAASSITDFWRRWHKTLSAWFRDYVYIPLGGSRTCVGRHVFNLFIVWFLTGLWHGAAWQYIIWGLAYFVLLVIEKYLIRPERFQSKWLRGLYQTAALLAICLLWVPFRATDLHHASLILQAMFGGQGLSLSDTRTVFELKENIVYLAGGFVFAAPFYKPLKSRFPTAFTLISSGLLFIGTVISISFILRNAYNPFLYFQF